MLCFRDATRGRFPRAGSWPKASGVRNDQGLQVSSEGSRPGQRGEGGGEERRRPYEPRLWRVWVAGTELANRRPGRSGLEERGKGASLRPCRLERVGVALSQSGSAPWVPRPGFRGPPPPAQGGQGQNSIRGSLTRQKEGTHRSPSGRAGASKAGGLHSWLLGMSLPKADH